MTHIRTRRDTSGNWTSTNPVLQLGEIGEETNTRKTKVGDGSTAWASLPYTTEPLLNAALTGTPTAPTPTGGDSSTKIATTQFVADATADFVSTASPSFTGNPTAPTPAASDDDTSIATTAYVKDQFNDTALTGAPTAPTPGTSDDSTKIATTEYVKNQFASGMVFNDIELTGDPTAPTLALGDDSTGIATTAFVENYQEDSGWVSLTINTGGNWEDSGGDAQYRIRNGLLHLRGVLSRTSGASDAPFTMPSGKRPLTSPHRGLARLFGASGEASLWFTIGTDGVADIANTQYDTDDAISLDSIAPYFII